MHVPGVRRATGSKHHLIIDATGIPLAVTLTGGNRNGLTDRLRRGSGVPGLLGEAEENWGRVGPGRVADCAAYLAGRVRELAPGSG
ncbi:hypothetical protein [Streptomyces albidoflavus]|uniref:hypothetical protein n=1 Tax=Streptomyces albidoflavus TaxID=1886 RepID=UPI000A1C979E